MAYRSFLQQLLDRGPYPTRMAIGYRLLITAGVMLAIGSALAITVEQSDTSAPLRTGLVFLATAILTLDLALEALIAVALRRPGQTRRRALLGYGTSRDGIVDIVAVAPGIVAIVAPGAHDLLCVLGILGFLKLARYAPGLDTLGSVVKRERRPLESAAYVTTLLLLLSSTILYLVERTNNPDAFGSIPRAMWWGIATLTTVGYGDAVPLTPLGKLLAGATAVLGLGMFALPASILARGFAEETQRRDFLTIWRMVAKVPSFAGLNAEQIAGIAALLRYYAAGAGDTLIRAGDVGEQMYFIVSGTVSVNFGGRALLREGDFFGEIALLRKSLRTATVRAESRCELLVLDIRDFRVFLDHSPEIAEAMALTAEARLSEQEQAATP